MELNDKNVFSSADWAFAGTSVYETRYAMQRNKDFATFSVQYALNCAGQAANDPAQCDGGSAYSGKIKAS